MTCSSIIVNVVAIVGVDAIIINAVAVNAVDIDIDIGTATS